MDLGHHAEASGNIENVVEKVGHRDTGLRHGSGRYRQAPGRHQLPWALRAVREGAVGRRRSSAGNVATMDPIDVDAFEVLVAAALEAIPDELRAGMENVAIIIDDESPPGRLYGLYEGIPLTKRGTYDGSCPEHITLFLATICRSVHTPDELARGVRVTLLHEVGHHFGLGEARLRELGWA